MAYLGKCADPIEQIHPLPKAKRYEWQKRDGEWFLVLVEVEVHTPSATITVEVSEEREVGE